MRGAADALGPGAHKQHGTRVIACSIVLYSLQPECRRNTTQSASRSSFDWKCCRYSVKVDRDKRILLLVRALDAGGSERQLTETATSLHKAGWTVHVGCFHDSGIRAAELRKAGVAVVRFPVRSFRSLSAVQAGAAFAQYAMRHGIALTHSFDAPTTMFSTFAGRLSRRRTILSSQRCYRTLHTTSERRLLRITDRLVDGIVVNCEAIRQHLIRDEHVRGDHIHLCYNGIDTTTFASPGTSHDAGSLKQTVVIGTVAVLRPEKGLLTLVEAFAQLTAEHFETKLLIVGDGPLRQPLEDLARSLGVAAKVQFEPSTNDVAGWLNKMDIFVLPSFSEALSNSLMEAMACGLAPVASDVGGNPELVGSGDRGLMFPAGDVRALAERLRCLVQNDAMRKRFGTAAASFIHSEMTKEKSAARMAAIYSAFL